MAGFAQLHAGDDGDEREVEGRGQVQGFCKGFDRLGGLAFHDVMQAEVEVKEAVQEVVFLRDEDEGLGDFISSGGLTSKDPAQDAQGFGFAAQIVSRFTGREQRLCFGGALDGADGVEADEVCPTLGQPQARARFEQFGRQGGHPLADGGLFTAQGQVAVAGFEQVRGAFVVGGVDGVVNGVVEQSVLLEPVGCGAVERGRLFWRSLLAQEVGQQGVITIPGGVKRDKEQIGAFDVGNEFFCPFRRCIARRQDSENMFTQRNTKPVE